MGSLADHAGAPAWLGCTSSAGLVGRHLGVVGEDDRAVGQVGAVDGLEVESVVTISLTAHGDDCDMTLTHERLPAEQIPSHRSGWTAIAEQLGTWLAKQS